MEPKKRKKKQKRKPRGPKHKSPLEKIYTPKQIQAIRSITKDFWLLILHGAKRSGKTVVNNDIFLQEIIRVKKTADELGIPEPQYILAGNSLGTLERNVLTEIRNKYGINFKFDKFNRFKLFGVLVCCFGHGTIKDMARIRGMTAFGAYINEATTGAEEVIREILNRCSGEGARVVMDTNPDHPEHYIKTDYIDKADGEKVIQIPFCLKDNTFLSPRYMGNVMRTTPSGLFYDRDILGLWVNAEGVVYRDFNKDSMVLHDYEKKAIVKYVAGVDWGYQHFGTISVLGMDSEGSYILVEEHKEQYKEIDYWVDLAKDIKERYGNIPFYCDTARPEHLARFRRENILTFDADKSVLAGIEEMSKLMKQERFYILDTCEEFLKEVYNYVWDTKRGEPVKANDDLLDSIRYAVYTENKKRRNYDYANQVDWGNYRHDIRTN